MSYAQDDPDESANNYFKRCEEASGGLPMTTPTGKRKRLSVEQERKALYFVRLLASYECAESTCAQPGRDAATGKDDGNELCGPCEAREFLGELP